MGSSIKKRIFYAKYILGLKKSAFEGLSMLETFEKIHATNFWRGQESASGIGSSLAQTEIIRTAILEIINSYSIKSILDIPCGDFNWMSKILSDDIAYLGADIVPKIIEKNIAEFERKNIRFERSDLTHDSQIKADLVICRDCLVHLSMLDISQALSNIIASQSKYLLLTSYDKRNHNYDIKTGDWRPLNFLKGPFHFPKPLLAINEGCTEANGIFADKSLHLYEVKSLKASIKKFRTSRISSLWNVLFASNIEY